MTDLNGPTIPVPDRLGTVIWGEDKPLRVTQADLANAIVDRVSWETRGPIRKPFGPVEGGAAIRYLSHLADEVAHILEHSHSIGIESAAVKAARNAAPENLGDAAACIEGFGWQGASVNGSVGVGIQKVLAEGGTKIAECLFREAIGEGLVTEL